MTSDMKSAVSMESCKFFCFARCICGFQTKRLTQSNADCANLCNDCSIWKCTHWRGEASVFCWKCVGAFDFILRASSLQYTERRKCAACETLAFAMVIDC